MQKSQPGSAVLHAEVDKRGNRQIIALILVAGIQNILDICHCIGIALESNVGLCLVHSVLPGLRHIDLVVLICTTLNRLVVHGDNLLALLAVGLGSGILHVLDGLVLRG